MDTRTPVYIAVGSDNDRLVVDGSLEQLRRLLKVFRPTESRAVVEPEGEAADWGLAEFERAHRREVPA